MNDLKKKSYGREMNKIETFCWFFNQNCLSWSNTYVGIACFLLSWFVLKRVLLLFGFWRVEHLLEIGGLVLDWSFFFLKLGTCVGLYSAATHLNSSLRDSSSLWIPWGIFIHVSCLKTLELEFLKLNLLLNSSFKNSRC